MAIHDLNPERRNFMGLSLCIVLFYMAGGEFSDSVVRLQVVNVTFSKPEVLAYSVWGLLIWFLFRYWLVNQGSWKKEFHQEISSEWGPQIFRRYIEKRFGLGDDYSSSYHSDRHWVSFDSKGGNKLLFRHIYKNDGGGQVKDYLEISTLLDRLVLFCCAVRTFFRKPSLSKHIAPYAMFYWAVFLGVKNAL